MGISKAENYRRKIDYYFNLMEEWVDKLSDLPCESCKCRQFDHIVSEDYEAPMSDECLSCFKCKKFVNTEVEEEL
jgi:hypothetical protein